MVTTRKGKPSSPSKKSPPKRAAVAKKHATDVVADAEERKERIRKKVAAAQNVDLPDSDDDSVLEEESPSPILDSFVESSTAKDVVKVLTPFTHQEFLDLVRVVGPKVNARWTGGRGPNPTTSYTDMIFILLSVLHIPKKAEAHAQGFKLKKTTFDNCLTKVSETLLWFSNMVLLTFLHSYHSVLCQTWFDACFLCFPFSHGDTSR